ncbi:hypothetical protein BC938DRAFT_483483 [Jimgerdemannia flammicorona]|uniref:Uncharacterized protein n=1 Tax=Jimgerdemannia flammicorona TaxID=994334 RepID=A0A433QBY1_9FUNG|nr:hypothetical protein BC938DRAFT_483483 [Jimgerdemannia flammicorona]
MPLLRRGKVWWLGSCALRRGFDPFANFLWLRLVTFDYDWSIVICHCSLGRAAQSLILLWMVGVEKYDEAELTEVIFRKPFLVVLFDGEKAVLRICLQYSSSSLTIPKAARLTSSTSLLAIITFNALVLDVAEDGRIVWLHSARNLAYQEEFYARVRQMVDSIVPCTQGPSCVVHRRTSFGVNKDAE